MKVVNIKSSNVIQTAVKTLTSGGLVIYPTETVYGAGVDATNAAAVAKLSQFKSRPLGKPYSVAVSDQKMAEKYVELNPTAKKLYQTFLPGPLTVISNCLPPSIPSGPSIPSYPIAPAVASETGTLGIRIPAYPLVIEIVKKLGRPITATSANPAWQKRPYQISDILNHISETKKQLIDLIIDAGELPHRDPSTVIDTTLDDPITLRVGDIKLTDENKILSRSPENTQNLAKELWQKYQHFAGQKAIIFALEGELGAGKTEFTKGLARALGLTQSVTSPTFQIINIYESPTINNLTHIDAWRLQSPKELEDLEFAQKITDKSVIALEWADRAADVIRSHDEDAVIIWVKIKYGKKENDRFISWGTL